MGNLKRGLSSQVVLVVVGLGLAVLYLAVKGDSCATSATFRGLSLAQRQALPRGVTADACAALVLAASCLACEREPESEPAAAVVPAASGAALEGAATWRRCESSRRYLGWTANGYDAAR